jgi:D-arginine dehydrogenase
MRIVVIGRGIAGVSTAAELAAHADVVLVERETVLAYHTTGRSAAMYFESYGHEASRPLTVQADRSSPIHSKD